MHAYIFSYCSEDTDQNKESWQSFFESSIDKKPGPILYISKDIAGEEIPLIFYHRKCHTIFNMKKDLDRISEKRHMKQI